MPTDSGATTVSGAAKRLSSLLQSEREPTESQEVEAQEEPEIAEASETETQAEAQETSEDDTQEQKYKVKVDGEELEVSLEELQKGYMMEANYRNKTTALNKQRESVEAKAQQIDEQLAEAQALLENEVEDFDSPEMKELRETDPDEYLKQYDKLQGKVKKFQKLKEKRLEEQQARDEKLRAKELEALYTAFPEWEGDQQKFLAEGPKVLSPLKNLGFTDQDLAAVSDHRIFLVAKELKALEALRNVDLEAKEVKPKPKSVKPGVPQDSKDRERVDVKAQRDRLRKTGNMRDAAKLLRM